MKSINSSNLGKFVSVSSKWEQYSNYTHMPRNIDIRGCAAIHRLRQEVFFVWYPFSADYHFPSFPKKYSQIHDRIQNLKVRSEDIWVTAFPKSGITWTMSIVMLLMNNIDISSHSFIFDKKQYSLVISSDAGSPMMTPKTTKITKHPLNVIVKPWMKEMLAQSSPRLMKNHLPAHFLPKDIWTVKP